MAKWSDFETHPVGTADRIKELEAKLAECEARLEKAVESTWQPIETAPKDQDILVWYDHDADAYYDPDDPLKLTDYAANSEGGEILDGTGVTVAKWQPEQWEAQDEYGSGFWMPAGWFSRGDFDHYEVVCNPTHWMPLPAPPSQH